MAKTPGKKTSKKTSTSRARSKPAKPAALTPDSIDTAPVPASRPAKAHTPSAVEKARAFAIDAARMASDDKCSNVLLLDVRGLSQIADFILIASGTSDRQMKSVLDHIEELGGPRGFKMVRSNSDDRATWLLADFVDVIVHLFEPNTRAHYDLEMMWGDAKKVEWERSPAESERPGRRRSSGSAPGA